MTDTPRTDRFIVNAQLFVSSAEKPDPLGIVDCEFARELERELNAATSENKRLTAKVAQLYLGAEEAKQRIKRLEEAGDGLYEAWHGYGFTKDNHLAAWLKAKEAKP